MTPSAKYHNLAIYTYTIYVLLFIHVLQRSRICMMEKTDVAVILAIPSISLNKRTREVLSIRCSDNNTSYMLTLNFATN